MKPEDERRLGGRGRSGVSVRNITLVVLVNSQNILYYQDVDLLLNATYKVRRGKLQEQ